jgi:undecaprenyl-diphosphatase
MDLFISQTLNGIVGQSIMLDLFIDFIQESYIVKGLFAVCILVMILAARKGDYSERQINICVTLILIFIALFLGRIMQMVLPFSPRPLHTEAMNLVLATGLNPDVLKQDNSFPSDHAVMFFTITASVLLYHRLAGVVLLCHAIFIICLPRLVLGFHWFSDIAAGALIGALIALLLHRPLVRWLSQTRLSALQTNHPAVFQGLLFAILCETATMYSGSRQLVSALADVARLTF